MIEGLVGVFIGWVLSILTEEGRAYRARRAAAAEERDNLRQAARLIGEELLVSRKLLQDSIHGKGNWNLDQRLPADVWNSNRMALARSNELGPVWNAVSEAYAELNQINWKVHSFKTQGVTPTDWEEFKVRLKEALGKVQGGISALETLY